MDRHQRAFLMDLLEAPSPSGYETRGQRVWLEYVADFADETRTDAYGNAIAVHEGSGPTLVVTGHGDEIGLIVRRIDDEGFVHPGRIGGADHTVSRGQHVTIHAADGPVPGITGQTAIHLRDRDEEGVADIEEQRIDIGAADGDTARELVEIGDPITFSTTARELDGDRLAARGLDDRAGTWVAAEALRVATEADVSATVVAVSTIQEEVGLRGARMIGHDLDPDAIVGIDVCHALDYPTAPGDSGSGTTLGGGPVVARGSSNHAALVREARDAAREAAIDVQLRAAGSGTGTDVDVLYTRRGGIPSMFLGVPTRYMHTPTEVIDTSDLEAAAGLLAALADRGSGLDGLSVDV